MNERKKGETRNNGFLGIPTSVLRSKAFAEFIRAPESAVYFHLCGWAIRGRMSNNGLGKKLYDDFYVRQRKVVARWDQEIIAEHLGFSKKSAGHISRMLKQLEDKWKALKIVKISSHYGRKINVYELGQVDNQGRESLYLMDEFLMKSAEERYIKYLPPDD